MRSICAGSGMPPGGIPAICGVGAVLAGAAAGGGNSVFSTPRRSSTSVSIARTIVSDESISAAALRSVCASCSSPCLR